MVLIRSHRPENVINHHRSGLLSLAVTLNPTCPIPLKVRFSREIHGTSSCFIHSFAPGQSSLKVRSCEISL